MKLKLSENIRMYRKQRKLTQEKLAEALGVTVGAVYKWESGLSQPELNMIVELADFFDISVDVLLGCEMKDNRLESTLERLIALCQTRDPAALTEAEKALARYPHFFKVVYHCAKIFLAFGVSGQNREQLRRAHDLLEQAIVLLPQNTDPRISEATINSDISMVLFMLDEREKGLDLLKKSNAGGLFSSRIGTCLAIYMDRPDEAAPFLSEALIGGMSDLLSAVVGYVFVFRSRGDWASALEIITWGLDFLCGLKAGSTANRKAGTDPGIFNRMQAELFAILAYVQAKAGMPEASRDSLQRARNYAQRFDSTPDYSLKAIRFGDRMDQDMVFDAFGKTASDSVSNLLRMLDGQELYEQWKAMET